jgi:acyl-coenzyme A thioesterase PaaI-like protein
VRLSTGTTGGPVISPSRSIVIELGLDVVSAGEVVSARAEVIPETCTADGSVLRTSVLATWADVVMGTAAGWAIGPRIPLTGDLEVHLLGIARPGSTLLAEASTVKVGRTVTVCQSQFSDEETGEPVAVSYASFIGSPDPTHSFPEGFPPYAPPEHWLQVPLAERLQCRTLEPGVVEMPRLPDGLNATGAIQGGLVAFAAEEAALSRTEGPSVVHSLTVRYLRPFSIGPLRARARECNGLYEIQLTDLGAGKLGAVATARLGPPHVRE